MNRRTPHTPAQPTLTRGDDTPRAACADEFALYEAARIEAKEYAAETGIAYQPEPWVYDVLIDAKRGPLLPIAIAEAKRICGSCELQATCLADNVDEQWVQTLIRPADDPSDTGACGSIAGHSRHRRKGEKSCRACREAWSSYKREKREAAA